MDTGVFASKKGMFSRSVLSLKRVFHSTQFRVFMLQQDVKSVKVGDERSTFEVPTVFFSENLIP